jgi:IBR domain, a half RING-finger domain/Ring finger domain
MLSSSSMEGLQEKLVGWCEVEQLTDEDVVEIRAMQNNMHLLIASALEQNSDMVGVLLSTNDTLSTLLAKHQVNEAEAEVEAKDKENEKDEKDENNNNEGGDDCAIDMASILAACKAEQEQSEKERMARLNPSSAHNVVGDMVLMMPADENDDDADDDDDGVGNHGNGNSVASPSSPSSNPNDFVGNFYGGDFITSADVEESDQEGEEGERDVDDDSYNDGDDDDDNNDEKKKKKKKKDVEFEAFMCPICMDDVECEDDAFSIRPCGHRYDRECLSRYLISAIDEARTDISCPDPGCDVRQLRENDMKRLIGAEAFRKYQDFAFANKFAQIRGARWCISPECQSALMGDADTPRLKCDMCGTEQCFQCRRDWHPNQTCEERAATDTVDSKFVNYAKRHKTRPCPRCGIVTSKTAGCNRMLSKKRNESKRKQSKDTNESFFTIARYDMSILSMYVFFCQLALS